MIHGLDELTSRYVRHVDLINGLVFIAMVDVRPGRSGGDLSRCP